MLAGWKAIDTLFDRPFVFPDEPPAAENEYSPPTALVSPSHQ
jgi:hypothetical protein